MRGRVSVVDAGTGQELTDSPWATKPELRGERVLLRPFTADDVEAMGPVLADPEAQLLTGSAATTEEARRRSPVLDDQTRRWYQTRAEQPDRLDLAVVDLATGRCVGEVVLNAWDPVARSVGFRAVLGPDGRGRGLGSEATRLLVDHAFATGAVHRISLDVLACNPRALRVYEKAGFVVEGVLRDAVVVDGRRVDEVLMARLLTDPPPTSH